ncbi:hypothetical protein Hamer_G030014 [Homarus americanus]|uniref:Uncharacterized protein n=1 Tax=Homarus americanus TaxID=6706 RepID=A0A8J5JKZ6_HOMAM|nr:hypothetical protein Hamer_G030014 [Homarus americanus]
MNSPPLETSHPESVIVLFTRLINLEDQLLSENDMPVFKSYCALEKTNNSEGNYNSALAM